ncbi:MAG: hypothetical protein AD742_20850 [Methylibium sp. NZG]|nr:MAG: hypothetical protein AD742_20850 [Methylibium sp. NZG]
MGLLSIFKRKADAKPGAVAASLTPEGVQQARARARQRLIGAVVLVAIGVIAFPLVFESQPRPIPVDIPIDIPRKDGVPPLVMPQARPSVQVPEPAAPSSKVVTEDAKAPASAAAASAAVAVGKPASAPTAAPGASKVASAEPTRAQEPREATMPQEPAKKASPPVSTAPVATPSAAPPAAIPSIPAPAATADAAKAKALLEGKAAAAKEVAPKEAAKPPPPKDAPRFVVQVGAFAESSAVQDTRAKLDKLGLKSFTQQTDTATGSRTRVRLGPFASREEAERALAKAKAGGVSGVVLTL